MAAQAKSFHLDSHSKIVSKNTSPRTSKMQNMSKARSAEELLKALIRKRSTTTKKGNNNVIESKPLNDANKKSIYAHNQQNQGGKELLKMVRKGTEKLNIKESKCKSTTLARMCFCSPTTHEGSFRCRLHRINAAKKSGTDKSNLGLNSKLSHEKVEFKPQLSRFGRVASGEVNGPHERLMQLSRMEYA